MTNISCSTETKVLLVDSTYTQLMKLLVVLLLIGILIGLFIVNLPANFPLDTLLQASWAPSDHDYRQVIYFYSFLPRITIALVVGGGLAIAGCVMQQVLRNPLASPTTLGVAAGAELGLACAVLFLPAGVVIDKTWFAFIGGLIATGLVFFLSARKGFAPIQMILAGMVISLFLGAVNRVLILLNEQQLTSMFIWGAGDLSQTDWQLISRLLFQLSVPTALLLLLQRPLTLLQVGDQLASSVGLKVGSIRLVSLILAVFMTSSIVSAVGIIGFVGLVAPILAQLMGARHFVKRLLLSAAIGAVLLLLADLTVQPFSGVGGELLPTGAITAVIGAPFLLWLLQRYRLVSSAKIQTTTFQNIIRYSFYKLLLIALVMAVLITAIAIYFGNSEQGWVLQTTSDILMLRYPRVSTAFFAGAVLAIAGCVIQRVTANPMASPEVMGVSSGVALILIIGILAGWITSRTDQLLLGSLGALLALGFMWIVARRNGLTPSQLVLSGVALSALLDAVIRVLLASGTDHAKSILVWLSGSTYLATQFDVASLVVVTVLLLSILLLLHRWLDILLLGDISASALGMNNKQVRFCLLSIAAVLVALATLAVGPLSFIGLLVPQITKHYGQYAAKHQLIIASLMGGIIMVVADWLGRNILFPWQLPAGLLASLIGGAFFLVLLRKTP